VFFRCVNKSKLKTVFGAIYSLLVMLIIFITSLGVFFYFFWITPVEANRISELSPNGVHVIEVVHRDQGALGGSTTVTVRRTNHFNLLLGELRYRPVHVHRGGWSEFFHIDNIRWDGNDRFYMYRSVYRGGEIYAFELVRRRWVRV